MPSPDTLKRFLDAEANLDFTYEDVGATAATPPAGFVVDHTRIRLGDGEDVFLAAKAALQQWKQFDLGWVKAAPPNLPIERGNVVAVMGYAAGLWWLNACRIVYVVDESGPLVRFGFAYGTLPGHVECGEERFLIEWDQSNDSVWYDVIAFSKPNHVLTRLGYRLVRRLQKRFGRDSAAAMLRAVSES
jgi:uncharacterized protein (UPF0548 family)